MDIPGVVCLVEHQQIKYFLKLSEDYNEYLIHVLNSGSHGTHGSSFKFTIRNTIYNFTDDVWKSLFRIIIVSTDVEPLVTDTNLHQDFKWNIYLNELLIAPHFDDCSDPITTGQFKMVPRIFLWIVSHVLRPKIFGFSRIDNA